MHTLLRTLLAALSVAACCSFSQTARAAVTKTKLGDLRRTDYVVTDVTGGSGGGISNLEEVVAIVTNYDVKVVAPREKKVVRAAKPRRLGPYLWEMSTEGEDWDAATNRFAQAYPSFRACTGVCSPRYHGRNLDWNYDKGASVVIRSPARDGKHAVLGLSTGVVTDDILSSGNWVEAYHTLPFTLSDGINDQGVVIQQNVLQKDVVRSGTWRVKRPNSVILFAIIRYALDRCATAQEAAQLLKERTFVPSEFAYDVHFLVSDRTSSFIVEDGTVYTANDCPTDAMTNFRNGTASYNADGTVKWETVETYGIGLERYDHVRTSGLSPSSLLDLAVLMRQLWYTKTYETNAVPYWYTEHCDPLKPSFTVLNARDHQEIFAAEKAAWHADYVAEHTVGGSRYRGGTTWQTVHTALYDKERLTLRLFTQEDLESERLLALHPESPETEDRLTALEHNDVVQDAGISNVTWLASNTWITVRSYILYFEDYCTNNYLAARLANYRAQQLEIWKKSVKDDMLLASAQAGALTNGLKRSDYFASANTQLVATVKGEVAPWAWTGQPRPVTDLSSRTTFAQATNIAEYVTGEKALPNDYTKLTNNAAFRQGVEAVSPPVDVQGVIDENIRTQNLCTVEAARGMTNNITFAQLKEKPTTISGYGITDAYTKTEADEKFLPMVSPDDDDSIVFWDGSTLDFTGATRFKWGLFSDTQVEVSDTVVIWAQDDDDDFEIYKDNTKIASLRAKANASDVYTKMDINGATVTNLGAVVASTNAAKAYADGKFLPLTGGTVDGNIVITNGYLKFCDFGMPIKWKDTHAITPTIENSLPCFYFTPETQMWNASILTPDGSEVLTKNRGDVYYTDAPTATNIAEYVFDTQKTDFIHYDPDVNSNRTALTLGTRATVAGTPAWSAAATYQQGDTVVHDGVVYVCIVSPREVVSPSPWGTQYTMWKPVTVGPYSMSVGVTNIASGVSSHAEGSFAHAEGQYAHAEGLYVRTDGIASHAEGQATRASGLFTHAEGLSAMASGLATHAEGNNTTASGIATRASGVGSTAAGYASHAEGHRTVADGLGAHAEGSYTRAGSATISPVDGTSVVYRAASHAEGWGAVATNQATFVWQGLDGARDAFAEPTASDFYYDHGAGTFNVNPVGGLSGFYVGSQALASIIPQVENNLTSTDVTKALSANMGRELKDAIDNIASRGRYLSLWSCTNGLPYTNPTYSPYAYRTGDYYIVGVVGTETNYRPGGAQYVTGTASTNRETEVVQVNDTYYYDGTAWTLVHAAQKEITFAALAGSPHDNTLLSQELNAKANSNAVIPNQVDDGAESGVRVTGNEDEYTISRIWKEGGEWKPSSRRKAVLSPTSMSIEGDYTVGLEAGDNGCLAFATSTANFNAGTYTAYFTEDVWGYGGNEIYHPNSPYAAGHEVIARRSDLNGYVKNSYGAATNLTYYGGKIYSTVNLGYGNAQGILNVSDNSHGAGGIINLEAGFDQIMIWTNHWDNRVTLPMYLRDGTWNTAADSTERFAQIKHVNDVQTSVDTLAARANTRLENSEKTKWQDVDGNVHQLVTKPIFALTYESTGVHSNTLVQTAENVYIGGNGGSDGMFKLEFAGGTWTLYAETSGGYWSMLDERSGAATDTSFSFSGGYFVCNKGTAPVDTVVANVAYRTEVEACAKKSTKISGISLSNDVEIADIPLRALKLVDEDTGTAYLLKVKSGALKLYSISE